MQVKILHAESLRFPGEGKSARVIQATNSRAFMILKSLEGRPRKASKG